MRQGSSHNGRQSAYAQDGWVRYSVSAARLRCLMAACAAVLAGGISSGHGATANVVSRVPGGDGQWGTPGNWSSAPQLPSSADDVVIGWDPVTVSGGTQWARSVTSGGWLTLTAGTLNLVANSTIGGPLAIGALASWLDGGTLNSAGHLALDGGGTWTSGTIRGAGRTTIAAGTTLAITPQTTLKLLDGHTLENAGTVTLSSSGGWMNTLLLSNSASISNLAGATFTINNATVNSSTTGPTFTNAGTVNARGTTTAVGVAFDNTGTVNVQQGTTLTLGGTVAQLAGTTLTGGTWHVGSYATLAVSSGANIITISPAAAVTLDGPGSTFAKVANLASN